MAPKTYSGRLAFDPDTGFHIDEKGAPVVTEDGGRTWRYASEDDTSHFDRYHERFAGVDSTENTLFELQMEHGREKAEQIMRNEHPHHYDPHPDDPHFEQDAKNADGKVTHTRIRSLPDHKSAQTTGHTDAWKDGDNE